MTSEESTTPDLLAALRRHRDALSRRDFDAVLDRYTPDAVIDGSQLGEAVFKGRDAIRGIFEDWMAPYEEHEHKAEDFRDFGNGVTFGVVVQRGRPTGTSGFGEIVARRVLVLLRFSGRGRASGLELGSMSTRNASVFDIEGGLVRRLALYWDRDRALADLALAD